MQLLHTALPSMHVHICLAPKGPDLICSPDMHLDDQVPVLVCHILKADIPQYASVIEKHIYPAEVLDGGIDDSVAVFDAVVIGNGIPSHCSYFIDNDIGSLFEELALVWCLVEKPGVYLRGAAFAFERTSEVVDDHIGTAGSEEKSVGFAQPDEIRGTLQLGTHERFTLRQHL